MLQLFPVSQEQKNGLFVSTEDFPKKLLKKILKKTNEKPAGFIVLPSIALNRKKESCILLGKNNVCIAHSSKPRQCSLFPFISLSEQPDFLLLYGFCFGLKDSCRAPNGWRTAVEEHYIVFSKYFEEIKKQGFKKTWGFFPKKGIVLLKNKKACEISQKEFFEIIGCFG